MHFGAVAAAAVEQQVEQHRQALERPHLARPDLAHGLAQQVAVQHQDGAAALLFHHGVAELGAVHLLVAVALALGVDDHPAGPGQRRVDEAPGADLVQVLRGGKKQVVKLTVAKLQDQEKRKPQAKPAQAPQPKPKSKIAQLGLSLAALDPETRGQFKVPVTFRGPNGAALQLGAQHSQALEAIYAHFPGIKIVTPGTPADAKGLLKAAIRDDDPVCVFEGEMLYNIKGEVPEDPEFVIPLGVADLKKEGSDVSIITHGKMIHVALQAATQLEKNGIHADVLDLRTLRPLDTDAILATVAKTNRVVLLEEGWPFGGITATIAALIQEEAFDHLDAPVLRVTQADVPMPYAKGLEKIAKPSAELVVEKVNQVLYR